MLERIIEAKKNEVAKLQLKSLPDKRNNISQSGSFCRALQKDQNRVAIIAEVKNGSPSKGKFNHRYKAAELASIYEKNGAAAISVITDQDFFYGNKRYIQEVKSVTQMPVLRKDFIIHELQIYESLFLGADAVLLIAAILEYKLLIKLMKLCEDLGLASLLEVHDSEDLKKVLDTPVQFVGINNRNLRNFKVSLENSIELAHKIPSSCFKISESGINQPRDLSILETHGFQAALIGEALVTSTHPDSKLRELTNYDKREEGYGL